MNAVTVKGITIGEGVPKICTPMVGKTRAELLDEARIIRVAKPDVVELRIDFFEGVSDKASVSKIVKEVAAALPEFPLLFTFRTTKEGGKTEMAEKDYVELNKTACDSGVVDLIDVELFTGAEPRDGLIAYAASKGVKTVVSNHDFFKTPAKEEIVSRLELAAKIGADIPKIAVMPTSAEDVLTLLSATVEAARRVGGKPIITMSMAGRGVISRFAGEAFGSALTFGAAKAASAPGQVPVEKLRNVLNILHDSV